MRTLKVSYILRLVANTDTFETLYIKGTHLLIKNNSYIHIYKKIYRTKLLSGFCLNFYIGINFLLIFQPKLPSLKWNFKLNF